MRVVLCACLFALACKSESKPAETKAESTTSETPKSSGRAHPRPSLPDSPDDRERPSLPDDDRPDWADPAVREERRAHREEMRKQREAALDTNKDGVVSDEERRQRMAPMHKRLDADANGKLTPDELATAQGRMGFDDPAAVDTDKNGEISLDELDAAMTARREQMRSRWRRGGSGSAAIPD